MIKWNIVKYIDCMDEKEGLPSLPDNSIEMCFTDPPYNVNYKNKKKSMDKKSLNYTDDNSIYVKWCKSWFNELKRICSKAVLIHCGFSNLNMWIGDIEKPKGVLWHHKEDVQTGDSISHLMKLTPILIYGELNKRFRINPLRIKNKYDLVRGRFLHPCPINNALVSKILERQKPKTIIDPFMGSGTTAHSCIQLGIKYVGYELEKEYKKDIDKRISQKSVFGFIKSTI